MQICVNLHCKHEYTKSEKVCFYYYYFTENFSCLWKLSLNASKTWKTATRKPTKQLKKKTQPNFDNKAVIIFYFSSFYS